jgi:hypothetical protein
MDTQTFNQDGEKPHLVATSKSKQDTDIQHYPIIHSTSYLEKFTIIWHGDIEVTSRKVGLEVNWYDTKFDSKMGLGISGAEPLGYQTQNDSQTE